MVQQTNKAHFVAKRFVQTYGDDYFETSPLARLSFICHFLYCYQPEMAYVKVESEKYYLW